MSAFAAALTGMAVYFETLASLAPQQDGHWTAFSRKSRAAGRLEVRGRRPAPFETRFALLRVAGVRRILDDLR